MCRTGLRPVTQPLLTVGYIVVQLSVSLSEVETLARKAARGAGYSWGMAEEAGQAARWLSRHGVSGPGYLQELLSTSEGSPETQRPVMSETDVVTVAPWHWRSRAGMLCPLCTGAALSDRAQWLQDGVDIALAPLRVPMLLVPFVAQLSVEKSMTVSLSSASHRVTCCPDGRVMGASLPLQVLRLSGIRIARVPDQNSGQSLESPWPCAAATSVVVPRSCWEALESLAHRTYVPASDASRSAAGSAGSDND